MNNFDTGVTNETTKTYKRCTAYVRSDFGFGIARIECRELRVTIAPYAQYAEAVHVSFIPKGARARRGFVETIHPSLVVVDGWGHPAPDNYEAPRSEGGVTTQSGRFRSTDPRWLDVITDSVSGATILADCRK